MERGGVGNLKGANVISQKEAGRVLLYIDGEWLGRDYGRLVAPVPRGSAA